MLSNCFLDVASLVVNYLDLPDKSCGGEIVVVFVDEYRFSTHPICPGDLVWFSNSKDIVTGVYFFAPCLVKFWFNMERSKL